MAAAKCNNTIGASGYTPAELFVGRGWRDNETIQLDVKHILEGMAKRREARRHNEERKRLKKVQKKEMGKVPYKDDDLNSSLVRLPALTNMKPGDRVTLIERHDKNEPRACHMVQKVDFQKRQVLLVRESGLDRQRGGARWICFSRISQVFPGGKEDLSVAVLSVEIAGVVEGDEESAVMLRGTNKLKRFMKAALGAIGDFAAVSDHPETALMTSPVEVLEPLSTMSSTVPTTVEIREETSRSFDSSGQEYFDVSTPPSVMLSSTQWLPASSKMGQTLLEPETDTHSGPGTMEEHLATFLTEQPTRSVNTTTWNDHLGSFEDISSETLSSAQLSQAGSALHRLVALPSGLTIGRRPSRTPPKRRLQPTPTKKEPASTKEEPEVKLEAKWTPIKASKPSISSKEEKSEQAQSTPKVKKETMARDKHQPTTSKPRKSKIPTSIRPVLDKDGNPVRRSSRSSAKDVQPGKYAGTCKR